MLVPRIVIAGLAAGALALAPTALAGQEQPAPPAAPPTPSTVFSNSRVIVEWAGGADHADKVDARSDAEVEFGSDLGNRKFQLVEVEPGQTARDAIQGLREDPAVVLAERDASVATNSIPNDPEFGQLWGLRNTGLGINGFSGAVAGADVNAPLAWDRTVGTPTTVIADIDSGYRFEYTDLNDVAWTNTVEAGGTPGVDDDSNGVIDDIHGADFIGNNGEAPTTDGDPTDEDLISGGHGVHTAGTMAAHGNDGVGITGVARNVSLMPLRVCSRFPGLEGSRCATASIVAAINYAGAMGARAANMSLGGNTGFQSEVDAIAEAKETLFVISAGNDGSDNDGGGSAPHGHHFPCDFRPQIESSALGAIDNIVCVAATDQADGLASFSDWGATSVDLGAPGTETLSTYPVRKLIDETFEADDFGSKWTATGTDGGFSRTSEAPLTSFGMSDSPGGAPVAGSDRQSTSVAVAVPAGFTSCTLYQTRSVSLAGGTYTYEVLLNGSNVGGSSPSSSGRYFLSLGNALQAGGNVQLRFRYTAGGAPVAASGVWLDEIELKCGESVGQATSYGFLQGTSMAAPHVTGAAGLLFSLEPAATVTEVKDALLAGVDKIPSLTGKTTSGGRLDIAKAMDGLEGLSVDSAAPAKPTLTEPVPGSGSGDNHPRIKGSAEAGSTVNVFKGLACAGSPVASGTAAQLAGGGIEVTVPDNSISFFTVIATDAARNKSACSAAASYLEDTPPEVVEGPPDEAEEREREEAQQRLGSPLPTTTPPPPPPPSCKVPKLAGKTLGQAKAKLTAAGCKLGKVTKPKAKRGRRLPALAVKTSAPRAGAKPASGKVNLTLGPKPKRKKHHH